MICVKLPPQITRLAMLTAGIAVVYFTARHFLVPPSFGKYGWYRGDALKERAVLPITYAGAASCNECHDDVVKKAAKAALEKPPKTAHAAVSCESCHGPMAAHVEDITLPIAKVGSDALCARCHDANPSRPEKFKQVKVGDHYPDQNCMACHSPHLPTEAP